MYKQAKLALIKYFGSVRQEPAPDPDDKVSMKVHDHQCKVDPEDTFYNRQASFQGYPNQLRPRQPFTSGQWRNPNPRPNTPRFQGQRFSKPLNSFNKDGKINLCNSCGSYRHLQANCPDRYETYFEQQEVQQEEDDQDPRDSKEEEAETQFTGFATYETFNEGTFKPHEVFASVVIDTGCVKSVAGKNWFAEFCNTLSPSTRSKIKREESNKCFKFGGEMKKTSIGLYTVPCSVGKQNVNLSLDVVESDIPCLISKEAMKRARVKIDLSMDKINIFGQDLKLNTTSSGHYVMKLGDVHENDDDVKVFLAVDDEGKEVFDEKELLKIHKNLGHPSRKVMEDMIKNAGSFNKNVIDILNKLYENCVVCIKFKKSIPRPKVSPPMASNFNQVVCMDLKIWPKYNLIILYMIDMFSRYVVATIIPNKKPESVIDSFLDNWVLKMFGAPESILVDNGGEFYNNKMRDLCENFNIKIL